MSKPTLYIICGFLIYCLPSIIILIRRKEVLNFFLIFLFNIALGWTVVFWISLLIEALFPKFFHNIDHSGHGTYKRRAEQEGYQLGGRVRQGKWLTPYVENIINWRKYL